MNVGSLFSGAGLMDWGLTLAGFDHAWFCERDAYCRSVLALRYPGVPIYEDVRSLLPDADGDEHEGAASTNGGSTSTGIPEPAAVDILAGGFPCQPFSSAGRRRGTDDERWLWPDFARLVRKLRPRYVIVENVPGLLAGHGGMGRVLGDLAECGYDAEWDRVFASSFGAPHLRERVFVVAYPNGDSESGRTVDAGAGQGLLVQGMADADASARNVSRGAAEAIPQPGTVERPRRRGGSGRDVQDTDRGTVLARRLRWRASQTGSAEWWAAEPDVGRVAHGVPSRLDRLAAIGNGVVPQIAQWIGERILEREEAR